MSLFVIMNEDGEFWHKCGEFIEPPLLTEGYVFINFPKNADLFKRSISVHTVQEAKAKVFKRMHQKLKEYRKLLSEVKGRPRDELVCDWHGRITNAERIPDLEKSIKRMRTFLQQMIAEKY